MEPSQSGKACGNVIEEDGCDVAEKSHLEFDFDNLLSSYKHTVYIVKNTLFEYDFSLVITTNKRKPIITDTVL